MPTPEPDPLKSLQQRIDNAANKTHQQKDYISSHHGLSLAMRMGVELVAGVGIGATTGYFLDEWLGSSPWFMILCFFMGAFAGFRNMLRATKEMDDTNTHKDT